MDGNIQIESEQGEGSSIILTVPLLQGGEISVAPDLPRATTENGVLGRVLLVDDALELQTLIRNMLEEMGIEVVVANNGKEGIERAVEGVFDLILMDVRMPVIDGITATAGICKQNSNHAPIIILAAENTESLRKEAVTAGAYATISKPISQKKLQQLMSLYCFA